MENRAADEACVSCGKRGAESRCEQCGVAKAPGGYLIERVVAETTHARLYQARAPDDSKVAVKELLFALVPDAQAIESFERESALLRTLDHPQIPNFIDSFREGEGTGVRLYLVQEFVDGLSLAARIDQERLSESQAIRIARDILRILSYLHGLSPRVIHRDVKPANIIQRPNGTLVLVDFDAARDLERSVTHRATVVGTFGYMPPEQLGGTVDVTADLYALGATLVHVLSRRPPSELFVAGEGFNLRDHINASEGFIAWLEKLCAVNRADRYQSAQDALRELEIALYPAPVVQKGNGKLALFVGLGVLAIAVALVAVGVGVWNRLPSFSFTTSFNAAAPPPVEAPPVVFTPEPEPIAEVDLPEPAPEPISKETVKRVERPAPPSPPPPPATRAERVQQVGTSFGKQPLEQGSFDVGATYLLGDVSAPTIQFKKMLIGRPNAKAVVPVALRGKVLMSADAVQTQVRWTASGDGVRRVTGAQSGYPAAERDLTIIVPVDLYTSSFELEFKADGQAYKQIMTVDLVEHTIVRR